MQTTIRLNTKVFPVITVLAFVMQIIDPSRVWMMLLIGVGGAWLICCWWARGLARGLRFEREMRFGWAQVGDWLEERFTLANHSPAPALWVELQDASTLPDHHGGQVTGIDSNASATWRSKVLCTRRGLFNLGPTTLRTGD